MSGKGDTYRKQTPEERQAFEINFDAIFGKKSKTVKEFFDNGKKIAKELDDWDEKRIDVVGQNGNDGLHYDK
jgi:hypothetical protein